MKQGLLVNFYEFYEFYLDEAPEGGPERGQAFLPPSPIRARLGLVTPRMRPLKLLGS